MPAAWQTTRNTYEAATLAALDIAVQPVTMMDRKTGTEFTDWNLACMSTVAPERHGRPFVTGELRRDYANGVATGTLATQPLHPFLIGARAMHNRARLLDAQKGRRMRLERAAPGSYILQAGEQSGALHTVPPHVLTTDMDMALAMLGIGCVLCDLTHNGREHVYHLTRYALPDAAEPHAPRVDGGALMHSAREGALWPAQRWEVFAHTLHTLHALRELRRMQHARTWITVRHRTPRARGAAFTADAGGELLGRVQRQLGVKI